MCKSMDKGALWPFGGIFTQTCHESDAGERRWRPCPRWASPRCPVATRPEPVHRPTLGSRFTHPPARAQVIRGRPK